MTTRIILDLDPAHAVAPLPVAIRWILKVLLRRFGVVCKGCEFQEQQADDAGTPRKRDPGPVVAHGGGNSTPEMPKTAKGRPGGAGEKTRR